MQNGIDLTETTKSTDTSMFHIEASVAVAGSLHDEGLAGGPEGLKKGVVAGSSEINVNQSTAKDARSRQRRW